MDVRETVTIHCPYCGEPNSVYVSVEEVGEEYIEDCHVCCRPIVFHIDLTMDGNLSVHVRAENETY